MNATDILNQPGDQPIDGSLFISRYEGKACKDSPAWKFRSDPADDRMNAEITAFWWFCFRRDLRWMEQNLGGLFLP